MVNPEVVVALGNVALRALKRIAPHQARLWRDVGRPIQWWGRVLIPLYHPGPRARLHRAASAQVADFPRLGEVVTGTRQLVLHRRDPQET
jgi:DNA polymerase